MPLLTERCFIRIIIPKPLLKSGGATTANSVGVPCGAIAELSATTKRTFAARYISALTRPSGFYRSFSGSCVG